MSSSIHTPKALPKECLGGRDSKPFTGPHKAHVLVGQTPPPLQEYSVRAGSVFCNQAKNHYVPPGSEVRQTTRFSSPVSNLIHKYSNEETEPEDFKVGLNPSHTLH